MQNTLKNIKWSKILYITCHTWFIMNIIIIIIQAVGSVIWELLNLSVVGTICTIYLDKIIIF